MRWLGYDSPWKKAWPVALALCLVLGGLCSIDSGVSGAGDQALAAAHPDGGGQAIVGKPVVGKHVQLSWSKTPPAPSAQERHSAEDAAPHLKVPVGPVHQMTAAEAAALRRTAGPPLPLPRAAAPATGAHAAGSQPAPRADSDFDIELNTPIGSGGICPSCSANPNLSPSVANDGKDILIAGNAFAAQSTDNGSTWSYLDPFATASSMGLMLGSYQRVVYEPSHDTFFWAFESESGFGAPTNGIGLVTQAGNLGGSACEYPFFPPAFGLPTGEFLAVPDIEYSVNFLYLSFVAFDASGNFVGTYVARLPLSAMVTSTCGSVTPQYVSRSDTFRFTLAQGATDTMYWTSNWYWSGPTSGDHVRVFFWPEKASGYTYQDKSIDPFNFIAPLDLQHCASQDGVVTNWCELVDSTQATLYRSRAGYRGFGAPLLGMAWTAGPVNGLTPFPYVVRYYFLLSNMSYKGHDNLYSPNYGVALPSFAAPTQRGYVGGTFTYGGGTGTGGSAQDYYPANGFLIEDADTPTQPWATDLFVGTGNLGVLGYYNTARAWTPDGLHWIAVAEGGTMGAVVPSVMVFGRGRDHNSYLRWANT